MLLSSGIKVDLIRSVFQNRIKYFAIELDAVSNLERIRNLNLPVKQICRNKINKNFRKGYIEFDCDTLT